MKYLEFLYFFIGLFLNDQNAILQILTMFQIYFCLSLATHSKKNFKLHPKYSLHIRIISHNVCADKNSTTCKLRLYKQFSEVRSIRLKWGNNTLAEAEVMDS